MKDSEFINQFAVVVGALVAITVFILVLANVTSKEYAMNATERRLVAERLKPVGQEHIGEVALEEAAAGDGQAVVDLSPEDAYQQGCAACHASGILNSPIYGDADAWAARKGDLNALYESAINGKGQMPAKGGRADFSDDLIRQIVDYMLDAV